MPWLKLGLAFAALGFATAATCYRAWADRRRETRKGAGTDA